MTYDCLNWRRRVALLSCALDGASRAFLPRSVPLDCAPLHLKGGTFSGGFGAMDSASNRGWESGAIKQKRISRRGIIAGRICLDTSVGGGDA